MDNVNITIKVEPEEFVVVKEETVDLTEENMHDSPIDCSMISLDSEPYPGVAVCPKSHGLNVPDAHVKSSFIISNGIKSEVDGERSPRTKYDVIKNVENIGLNPPAHVSHPVVPTLPLPYLAHAMPWGMYPHSPYLPYSSHQIQMNHFIMQTYPNMLGHFRHPNNHILYSTPLPPLEVSEKLATRASFRHQGTPEHISYAPDLQSNLRLEKRRLNPGKVKKISQSTSSPYNKTESKSRSIGSPPSKAKHTENNAHSKIQEQPSGAANQRYVPIQASDHHDPQINSIDIDGQDDISMINKLNSDHTRPFKCSECDKGFAKKSYLYVHMKIHTGKKSYRCSKCPMAFKRRRCLIIHQDIHYDRSFECSLCDRRFTNKYNLKRHFVAHIPLKSGGINTIS